MGLKSGLRFEKEGDIYNVIANMNEEKVGEIRCSHDMWLIHLNKDFTVFHYNWLKQITDFMETLK